MKKRDLPKTISKEGAQITPDVLDAVYEKLDLAYVESEKEIKVVEESIKGEAKVFMPDCLDTIYAKIGVNYVKNSNEEVTENRLKDEAVTFVPNKEKQVLKTAGANSFWFSLKNFIKKPVVISVASLLLVAGISVAIVLPLTLNSNETDDKLSAVPNTNTSVDLAISPASGSNKSEVMYTVQTTGTIDNDTIVAINDNAEYIYQKMTASNAESTLDLASFTEKYLSSALSHGYIEKQDPHKTNDIVIEIAIVDNDDEYFQTAKTYLETKIVDFFYKNKIIGNVSIIQSSSVNLDDYSDVVPDSELLSLIYQAFELSKKLFVDANGDPLTVFFFSSDFADWVDSFKDTDKQQMRGFVDRLRYIDSQISTDENRALFSKLISEQCQPYYDNIQYIRAKETSMLSLRTELINAYVTLTNDPILSTAVSNNDQGAIFNFFFGEGHDDDRPGDRPDDWKWWEDGYDNPHDEPYHLVTTSRANREIMDDFESFKEDLEAESFEVDRSDQGDLFDMIKTLYDYQFRCEQYASMFDNIINRNFRDIISRLNNGDFSHGEPGAGDHHNDEPDGWDDDFEEWWKNH